MFKNFVKSRFDHHYLYLKNKKKSFVGVGGHLGRSEGGGALACWDEVGGSENLRVGVEEKTVVVRGVEVYNINVVLLLAHHPVASCSATHTSLD